MRRSVDGYKKLVRLVNHTKNLRMYEVTGPGYESLK